MDYTVRGILQARILEWVVFPFSRRSSQPRDRTQVSCIAGGFFTSWVTREAHIYSIVIHIKWYPMGLYTKDIQKFRAVIYRSFYIDSWWTFNLGLSFLVAKAMGERVQRFQFSSVAQSCPTLCYPMNRSTPGLPVHHQLPAFTQTHIHGVRDAIQPSHPLSFSSSPAPNPSQHQSLFQWVNSSHEVAKVLEFQF